jgi:hypothetical protein
VHTGIVDLSTPGVDGLEQLIHLIVRHLLAQVRQDIPQLANADETRHVLVEYLEAPAVLLGLAGIAEAAWSVEDLGEGLEIDCTAEQD